MSLATALYFWTQERPIMSALIYAALAGFGVWALTGMWMSVVEAGCLGFVAWAVVFGRGL